jgi:glycolate oxidase iron-sulfur subunit
MAGSNIASADAPKQVDLDKCVHCGLCLNACPTYRELRVEMDSPRGRIYQMVQVANGAPVTESYAEHIDLCLACRACETACPSGVKYGRLVEAARADIESRMPRKLGAKFLRWLVFEKVLPSRMITGYAALGLRMMQALRVKLPGRLGELTALAPKVERPFFYRNIGKVFPAKGERKHRVAFLSGCIANVCFARLNEATVRVLQANGCEVTIPESQTCCGALHVHAGLRKPARRLARQNIDAVLDNNFDAIITNAGGCGSTLKEYDELLEHDREYAERAKEFVSRMKDVNEFLASIELNPKMRAVNEKVTYQDSCHLAHGQRVSSAPRSLLKRVPGLELKEMSMSDSCCGSAGIYNVVHTDMSMALLEKKMAAVNATGATRIVTANPGCMLQLRAGVERWGRAQRVSHVIEILDEAYDGAGRDNIDK